jgi:energy-converting hydrogenase Eha subunit A
MFGAQRKVMSQRPSRLSDPQTAANAWARFRWIMRWVLAATVLAVALTVLYLRADGSVMTVQILIAAVAGVGLSVLLAGALMGLVFLSAGSGHDADVSSFTPDEKPGDHLDRRPPD